jgi:hypothetical protein
MRGYAREERRNIEDLIFSWYCANQTSLGNTLVPIGHQMSPSQKLRRMDDLIYLGSYDDFSGLMILTPMTDENAPSCLRRIRMAPLSTLPPAPVLFPLPAPLENPPAILFRAECQDRTPWTFNGRDYDMAARDRTVPIPWESLNDRLSWEKVDTPFIPFTRSWEVVLRRRHALIQEGHQNVVIVAIWAKGMRNVYDAYEITRSLKLLKGEDPDKDFEHFNEYLVHGGISADEERVLAIFDGQREHVGIHLRVPVPGLPGSTTISKLKTIPGSVTIPESVMINTPGSTARQKLEYAIYQRTGLHGDSKQLLYLIGFMIGAFDCPWTSFVVVDA